MQTIKHKLTETVYQTLQSHAKSGQARCEDVSEKLVEDFFKQYSGCEKKQVMNAIVCANAREELEALIEAEDKSMRMTALVLVIVLGLTAAQLYLVASSSILMMIPLFMGMNISLLLIGYLAAECRYLKKLEENKKVFEVSAKVLEDFGAYVQNLKEKSAMPLKNNEIKGLIKCSQGLIEKQKFIA